MIGDYLTISDPRGIPPRARSQNVLVQEVKQGSPSLTFVRNLMISISRTLVRQHTKGKTEAHRCACAATCLLKLGKNKGQSPADYSFAPSGMIPPLIERVPRIVAGELDPRSGS